MAKFHSGSHYAKLMEEKNDGTGQEDFTTLIGVDQNEIQSEAVRFSNNTNSINNDRIKSNGNISTQEKWKDYVRAFKSDKIKTFFSVLIILSFIILFCHVIYINFKMRELRKSLEEEKAKIANMQQGQMTANMLHNFDSVIKMQDEFEARKAQLDRLEESHRTHIARIQSTYLNHQEQLKNLSESLEAKGFQIDSIESTLKKPTTTVPSPSNNTTIANSPPISTNGVLIWKVENYTEKLEAARDKGHVKVYSEPFYTEPFGYKICMFICPYGDHQAKGTHLSIYFNLMKGEMDEILKWPFHHQVKITLIDQSLNSNDLERSFWPENHDIFKKPTAAIAPRGWGWQRFIALDSLKSNDHFLRNDTIYVKMVVLGND